MLGFFAQRDSFVATNFALRGDLGGWNSREWKDAKRLAKARWRFLFGTFEPLTSTKPSELVSGAINGKYFK